MNERGWESELETFRQTTIANVAQTFQVVDQKPPTTTVPTTTIRPSPSIEFAPFYIIGLSCCLGNCTDAAFYLQPWLP